jgi:hypothetical protein
MGRKLGATPRFGKAAKHLIVVVRKAFCVHLPGLSAGPGDRAKIIPYHPLGQQNARANRPGFS